MNYARKQLNFNPSHIDALCITTVPPVVYNKVHNIVSNPRAKMSYLSNVYLLNKSVCTFSFRQAVSCGK